MKLDWSKNNMRSYVEYFNQKEKLDRYEKTSLSFYTEYLSFDKKENIDVELDPFIFLNNKELLKEIKQFVAEFEYLISKLPKRVFTSFFNLVDCLQGMYKENNDSLKLPRKSISNQELFDNSYEIYGSISPLFNKCLDNIYEKKLVKVESSNKSWYQDSCCNVDFLNELGYVYVSNNDKDISLYAIHNHELAHSISALININCLNTYINEFPSIYMNFYTDLKESKKINNNYHLISYYNYMNYLQEKVVDFAFLFALIKCDKLTKKNIEDTFYKSLTYNVYDFNKFFNYFLYDANAFSKFTYLFSGCCALHLLNMDFDKQKRIFTDFNFTEYTNNKDAFKMMELNLKDPYYLCDLFNTKSIEAKKMVRKK